MFENNFNYGNGDSIPEYMQQMMQGYWGGLGSYMTVTWVLGIVISILLIILLLALIRYVWKLGDKH